MESTVKAVSVSQRKVKVPKRRQNFTKSSRTEDSEAREVQKS